MSLRKIKRAQWRRLPVKVRLAIRKKIHSMENRVAVWADIKKIF